MPLTFMFQSFQSSTQSAESYLGGKQPYVISLPGSENVAALTTRWSYCKIRLVVR